MCLPPAIGSPLPPVTGDYMKTHLCSFCQGVRQKTLSQSRGYFLILCWERYCPIWELGNIFFTYTGQDRPTHRGGMSAAVAKLDNSFVSVSCCVCLGTTAFVLFRQSVYSLTRIAIAIRVKRSYTCPPSGCHTLTPDRLTARNQLQLQISCLSECAGHVNSGAHFLSCLDFCKTP